MYDLSIGQRPYLTFEEEGSALFPRQLLHP